MISGITSRNHVSSQISGTPVTASSRFDSETAPSFRPPSAAIEPFADLELVVRRHPRVVDEPGDEASRAGRRSESAIADLRAIDRLMAAIPDHARPQTIWVNIPKNQYEVFKHELNALGTIESEMAVPLLREQHAGQADGQIRVKLIAIPTTETPISTAPANR
jgi:hypothetical protein